MGQKTVFVSQIPHKRAGDGTWIPSINIGPAMKFGQIEVCVPFTTGIFETKSIVEALDKKLRDYDYDRGDSILLTGDPCIIAMVGAIVAEYTDRFRILKWERNVSGYHILDVCLPQKEEGECQNLEK